MNPANTKSRPQTKPLATNPGRASPFVDAFQYFESEPDTEEEDGVRLRETASEVLARRKRTNGRKTGPAPAGLLLPSKANSISRSAPGTGTLAVLDDAKRKREKSLPLTLLLQGCRPASTGEPDLRLSLSLGPRLRPMGARL